MGFSLFMYLLLALTGSWMLYSRKTGKPRPNWLRSLHYIFGGSLVLLVLLLLTVGIVGTLGHFGSLGHSLHLPAGLTVVALVLFSAFSATQIRPDRPWMRRAHISANLALLVGFSWVSLTGWTVVQKYLP